MLATLHQNPTVCAYPDARSRPNAELTARCALTSASCSGVTYPMLSKWAISLIERGERRAQLAGRRLPADADRARVVQCVVVDADVLKEPAVDQMLLEGRDGLVDRVGEHVRSVRARWIGSHARPLPFDEHRHRPHRRLGDHRLAARQRRDRRNGIRHEWVGLPGPVAEDLLRQREHMVRVHITGDDERRVVGHVVAVLDLAHLLRRHVTNDVAVTDHVLPAPVARIELLIHRLRHRERTGSPPAGRIHPARLPFLARAPTAERAGRAARPP